MCQNHKRTANNINACERSKQWQVVEVQQPCNNQKTHLLTLSNDKMCPCRCAQLTQ